MIGFLIVALFLAPNIPQPKSMRSSWRPANFRGLVVGKSRRSDMLRRLGQPKWSRTHQSEKRGDEEKETFNHYEGGGEFAGTFNVVVSNRGIVSRIDFFPSKLSRDQAIAHFGSNYLTTKYALNPCGDEDSESIYESANGPLTYLEYRERGIAIAIGYEGLVTKILYVSRPIGESKPDCE